MVRIGDTVVAAATAALTGPKVLRLKDFADIGIPTLTALYTSDASEARDFLDTYLDSPTLGLDMTWKAHEKGEAYSRSSLLQIASNTSVLIFDLLPMPDSKRPAKQLSEKICGFLQMSNRSFYDIAMPIHAARMAFELNCVIPRGVRLGYQTGAGQERFAKAENIIALGNKVLRTKAYLMSAVERAQLEKRPLARGQLRYAAERAYLSWAVAERFLKKDGSTGKTAFVSKAEIYAAGELLRTQGMPERKTRFDWSRVKRAFLNKNKANAKKNAQDAGSKTSPAQRQREVTSPTKTVGSSEVAIAANEFAVLKMRDAERKKRAAEKAEAEAAAAIAEDAAQRKKKTTTVKRATSKKELVAKKVESGPAAAAAKERKAAAKQQKTAKPEMNVATPAKAAKNPDAASPVAAAEEFAAKKKRDAARKRRAAEKAEAEAEVAAAVAKQEAEREEKRKAAKAAKQQANLASRKASEAVHKPSEPRNGGRRSTSGKAASKRQSGNRAGRKATAAKA